MSDLALQPGTAPARPGTGSLDVPVVALRDLIPWAIFVGALMLLFVYFVGAEEGATSIIGGHWVHEFAHDGRHLLGFPCH